jgi:hypothetical protein
MFVNQRNVSFDMIRHFTNATVEEVLDIIRNKLG